MSRRGIRRAAKPASTRQPSRPETPRPPARPAQPARPCPDTRPAVPKPGAWQMNPDLWYRPDTTLASSFTFAFTGPQPEGAPPGTAQELGRALIEMVDAHIAQEETRFEIDFEGEPFL